MTERDLTKLGRDGVSLWPALDELFAKLEVLASRPIWMSVLEAPLDMQPPGSVYGGGMEDGETILARELLKTYFGKEIE